MSGPPKKPKATATKPKAKKHSNVHKPPAQEAKSEENLLLENAELRRRLEEAEDTLNAIRAGEVDALVVSGSEGEQIYTLKGAEQPYRILVESMNEGALSLMEDGVIINCNRAFSNVAGRSCGMLVGSSFREFLSKKDAKRFDSFWKETLECESRIEIELIFDGRIVPVYISAGSRIIESQHWVFAVVTDITERKRTEEELNKYRKHLEKLVEEQTRKLQVTNEELHATNEELQTVNEELQVTNEELLSSNDALRESEERFRVAQEVSPDGFTILRPVRDHGRIIDFTLVYENAAIARLNNTDPHIVIGKRLLEVFPGHAQSPFMEVYRRVANTGKPDTLEAPYHGDTIRALTWFRVVVVPIGGDIAILAQDITEKKRSEELLRREAQILAQVHDSVIATDLKGNITLWNVGAERLFGFAADEVIGRSVAIIYFVEDLPVLHNRVIAPVLAADKQELELRCRDKSNRPVFVHLSLSLLRDEKGFPYGIIGFSQDITQRKKAEEVLRHTNEELLASNKELDAFVYSVSHDLRAPLRSIGGFSKMLANDYAAILDPKGQDFLDRIQKNADKMGRLIEGLLQLSHISRQKVDRRIVNLSEAAETVVYNLRAASPERNVRVVIEKGLKAAADANLITILLTNLIGNAWKFIDKTEEAEIEFGALRQSGKMVYFVRDNGAGFDQAFADKLFLPFQRLHSSNEFEGSGIGLSIAERIVRAHCGKVWAEGQVGKGATFYFTLDDKDHDETHNTHC